MVVEPNPFPQLFSDRNCSETTLELTKLFNPQSTHLKRDSASPLSALLYQRGEGRRRVVPPATAIDEFLLRRVWMTPFVRPFRLSSLSSLAVAKNRITEDCQDHDKGPRGEVNSVMKWANFPVFQSYEKLLQMLVYRPWDDKWKFQQIADKEQDKNAYILWIFLLILCIRSCLNTMCALCEYIRQELQAARVDGGLEGDDIDRIFLPPLSVLAAWLFLRGGGPS